MNVLAIVEEVGLQEGNSTRGEQRWGTLLGTPPQDGEPSSPIMGDQVVPRRPRGYPFEVPMVLCLGPRRDGIFKAPVVISPLYHGESAQEVKS